MTHVILRQRSALPAAWCLTASRCLTKSLTGEGEAAEEALRDAPARGTRVRRAAESRGMARADMTFELDGVEKEKLLSLEVTTDSLQEEARIAPRRKDRGSKVAADDPGALGQAILEAVVSQGEQQTSSVPRPAQEKSTGRRGGKEEGRRRSSTSAWTCSLPLLRVALPLPKSTQNARRYDHPFRSNPTLTLLHISLVETCSKYPRRSSKPPARC